MSALIFGSYQATWLAATAVLAWFGRPSLVRMTSRISTNNVFMLPILFARKQFMRFVKHKEAELLDGVILEEKLESQLREVSYAILNRRKHFAPCKNMLFYGPPGTGKTLFA